jgi:hypothetical protein
MLGRGWGEAGLLYLVGEDLPKPPDVATVVEVAADRRCASEKGLAVASSAVERRIGGTLSSVDSSSPSS